MLPFYCTTEISLGFEAQTNVRTGTFSPLERDVIYGRERFKKQWPRLIRGFWYSWDNTYAYNYGHLYQFSPICCLTLY